MSEHTGNIIVVTSSNGEFYAMGDTGIVTRYEKSNDAEEDMVNVMCFDLDEWAKSRPDGAEEPSSIDILDLEYYYIGDDGNLNYEPPCRDWRELRERNFDL